MHIASMKDRWLLLGKINMDDIVMICFHKSKIELASMNSFWDKQK